MSLDESGSSSNAVEGPSMPSENGTLNSKSFFKQFLFPDTIGPGWDAKYVEKPPQTSEIQNWAQVRVFLSNKYDTSVLGKSRSFEKKSRSQNCEIFGSIQRRYSSNRHSTSK